MSFQIKGYEFARADLELMMYLGYQADELDILLQLQDETATSESGFILDCYGIRTRTASLWPAARAMDGTKYPLPIPGNFHWETIEWLGIMRAVLEAENTFRVMELGAGWGPAIVSSSVLARRRGISDIRMTGVEGDPHHYASMIKHVEDNGFKPSDHALHNAAVAVEAGLAEWPVTDDSSGEYGFRPLTEVDDYMGRVFAKTQEVKLISMKELVLSEDKWDLIHIDVQGSEFSICENAFSELTARAKRIMIGTHSRKIEGDLICLFGGAGWILENEKPCKFYFSPGYKSLEALTTVDGTQTWRNPSPHLPKKPELLIKPREDFLSRLRKRITALSR